MEDVLIIFVIGINGRENITKLNITIDVSTKLTTRAFCQISPCSLNSITFPIRESVLITAYVLLDLTQSSSLIEALPIDDLRDQHICYTKGFFECLTIFQTPATSAFKSTFFRPNKNARQNFGANGVRLFPSIR